MSGTIKDEELETASSRDGEVVVEGAVRGTAAEEEESKAVSATAPTSIRVAELSRKEAFERNIENLVKLETTYANTCARISERMAVSFADPMVLRSGTGKPDVISQDAALIDAEADAYDRKLLPKLEESILFAEKMVASLRKSMKETQPHTGMRPVVGGAAGGAGVARTIARDVVAQPAVAVVAAAAAAAAATDIPNHESNESTSSFSDFVDEFDRARDRDDAITAEYSVHVLKDLSKIADRFPKFNYDTRIDSFFKKTEGMHRVFDVSPALWSSMLIFQTQSRQNIQDWCMTELLTDSITWSEIKAAFARRYGKPDEESTGFDSLMNVRQGSKPVAVYRDDFCRVARLAGCSLDEPYVIAMFRRNLNDQLQDLTASALIARGTSRTDFDAIASVCVALDADIRAKKRSRGTDRKPFSCFTCDGTDHKAADCPNDGKAWQNYLGGKGGSGGGHGNHGNRGGHGGRGGRGGRNRGQGRGGKAGGGKGRSQGGASWKDTAECHFCHEIGHIKPDCPKRSSGKAADGTDE